MALSWSEDLSVGNGKIDSEHKSLIVMVNNLEHAIRAGDLAAFLLAFEHIEHCLYAHFANEAKVAQAIEFNFTNNEVEHINLLKMLHLIKDAVASISGNSSMWTEDAVEHYSEFLSDWLTNHVINEDMLMKPVLQTYPYDFNPV